MLASARRMLREHELLQQELQSSAESPRGQLHIGAVPMCMPIAARFVGMLHKLHPGIVCTLRSMSSPSWSRAWRTWHSTWPWATPSAWRARALPLRVVPQYTEHYFLLRRAKTPSSVGLQKGPTTTWAEAAALPLCLLTSEMHNRTIVDSAFRRAQVMPRPAIETCSILTLALSVVAGRVSSIMPGALVDAVQGYGELEALPLIDPFIEVPIALMVHEQPPLAHAGGRARLRTGHPMAGNGRAAWQSVRGFPRPPAIPLGKP